MARTCWQYILQALEWARKYGLRVKIDLHTIPGSQNGEPLFDIESHIPEAGRDLPGSTVGINKSPDPYSSPVY